MSWSYKQYSTVRLCSEAVDLLGASPNSAAVVFHPYVLSLSISGESHLHSISGVLGAIANAGTPCEPHGNILPSYSHRLVLESLILGCSGNVGSEIQASVSGNALLENNVASDGGGCFYSTFDAVLTFSGKS
eukprot:scaffold1085_cov407-Prasinococcus_capsulatus_cf.AAC.70